MQHPDLTSPAYQYMTGALVDTLSLSMESQAIVKGSAALKAMGASITTTRFASSSDGTAEAFGVMNSSSNVARIGENGSAFVDPVYALSLTMQIANAVRQLPGIGTANFVGVNMGRQMVTGSCKAYFGNTTLLTKALAATATSLDWVITDSSGYTYQIDLPKVKFSTAQAVPSGLDQDITVDLDYQSIKYTNIVPASYQVQVCRSEQSGTNTATI
jgi:hypothetical protein